MQALCRHRPWLTPWFAAALLWAQWLTAAYGCPQLQVRPADEGAPGAIAAMTAPMPDCAGHGAAAMDTEQPQLCKAHCQADGQTVNSHAGAFDAPAQPLAAAALVGLVAAADPGLPAVARGGARASGPPRGAPPLYLSLLVLRN